MTKKILFASGNPGKIHEVRSIASEFDIRIIAPAELAQPIPFREPEENGASYEENARIKARAGYAWAELPTLADDSGLEVDCLNGRPGIRSARLAGPGATADANIKKLLALLRDHRVSHEPKARFVSALVMMIDAANEITAEGVLHGSIAAEPSGHGGFGYDSIFTVEGFGETLATLQERDAAPPTHRVMALRSLFARLRDAAGSA